MLAVPVAPPDSVAELREVADEVVSLETRDRFRAIGDWYADFSPRPPTTRSSLPFNALSRSPQVRRLNLEAQARLRGTRRQAACLPVQARR